VAKIGSALEFRSSVPARAESVAFVRGAIRSFASTWADEGWASDGFDDERAGDLALVYTELITNAVRHSGVGPEGTVEVRLTLGAGGISGSVTDGGRGFPAGTAADHPRVDGGLGLFIVERLVRCWGVEHERRRTKVWFEF
jgi:anti-sigma regulatory factor (Ser/Thr protein kinase)